MTYEDFTQRIADAGLTIPRNEKFEVSWTVGGDRGHTIYGDERGEFSAEPEPDYWVLDVVLLEVCPNIPLMAYRKLINECVSYSGKQRDDYYGVHEELMCKSFYLKEVYDFLVANGLFS